MTGLGRLLRRLDQLLLPGGRRPARPGPPAAAEVPKPPAAAQVPKPPAAAQVPKPPAAAQVPKPPAAAQVPKPPAAPRQPGGGRLRNLDERFAGRGMRPQLAYVAVAVLLVAGALAALVVRHGSGGSSSAHPPAATPAATTSAGAGKATPGVAVAAVRGCPLPVAGAGIAYVGPAAHQDVVAYLSEQRRLLNSCADSAGGQRLLAVVSLSTAVAPEGAARIAGSGSIGVLAAYALLPGDALARILPFDGGRRPVTASATVTGRAFAAAAAALAGDASSQEQRAAGITATDPAQQGLKADDLAAAAADRAAAAGLAHGCACIYGLLVEAKISVLRGLAGKAGVRLVALAPPGTALDGLTPRPLMISEQDQTGTSAPPIPLPGG